MRVVVTGASGFVGSRLSRLLAAEHEVVAAVRAPGTAPASCEEAVVGSIETATWHRVLRDADAVVHLAARVHHDERGGDAAYLATNVEATRRLAEASQAAGVQRFVLMSSIKAAGGERDTPYVETDAPAPADAYGRSKLEAERVVLAMPRIGPVVLRPPVVYGPGVKGNIARLMRQLRRGGPIPVARPPNRRSLVFLDNLCDATLRALHHPAAPGEVFHLHDGEAWSTEAIVRGLARAMGRPARIVPVPARAVRLVARMVGRHRDAERIAGSLHVRDDKLRRTLGWAPTWSTEQGLRATVAALEAR